jgi:hypothetical protein
VSQLAPIDAPSKTYIAVIQSRAVVEQIVLALGLHSKKRLPDENYYKEFLLQFKDSVMDSIELRSIIEDIMTKFYGSFGSRPVPFIPLQTVSTKGIYGSLHG